jgi:NO-binding membrane sensor protein with MHYT domain
MMSFDPTLVILSLTIAIVGVFTAAVMTSGLAGLPPGEGQTRLVMAAISLGGAIWSQHFVGLLAMEAPVNWSRNPGFIAASGFIALVGTALAMFVLRAANESDRLRLPTAIAILGLCIAATTYLGLGAAAGRGVRLSWFLILVDLAICMQAAGLILLFMFMRRGLPLTFFGSIALGLALGATHYMAVYSAEDLGRTLAAIPPEASGIPARYLAWSTTIMTYLVCGICICIYLVMQFRDEIEE